MSSTHEGVLTRADVKSCLLSYFAAKSCTGGLTAWATYAAAQISEGRKYLHRIVSVITFLAKQGIASRGHSEGEDSSNQGNFLECIKLLSKFDPFLQQDKAPTNATYLSPSSQNEFILHSSAQITAKTMDEVSESKMFLVMDDEAKDGNSEQLAVCVHYVC